MTSSTWNFKDLSKIAKIFLALILMESLVLIALTIQRMAQPKTDYSEKFSALMLVNTILLLLFALDGVVNENLFELVAFVLVNVFVTFFIFFQFFYSYFSNHSEDVEMAILWIRFLSVLIFTPINVILSFLVYRAFGWRIYRKIGASVELTDMYRVYQQWTAILKLDLQFGINLVMMAGFFLGHSGMELTVDIIALAITFLWALLGWFTIRSESRLVYVFFAFAPLEPGYLLWKLVVYLHNGQLDSHEIWTIPFYIMGILAVICRTMLVTWAYFAFSNYGKGLREVFNKEDIEEVPILGKGKKIVTEAAEGVINTFASMK